MNLGGTMGRRIFLAFLVGYSILAWSSEHQGPDVCRERIFQALMGNHILEPTRILAHYSHTCDLTVDGGTYPVVDVRELEKNAKVARGVNRIVIFTSEWKKVQIIDYFNERPLFCRDNSLYVFGDISIASIGTYYSGNVIVFRDHAKKIDLKHVDWVSLPTLDHQK
jgi:hypothetical protein